MRVRARDVYVCACVSHLPATMNIQVAISVASSSASSPSSARTASHSSRPRRLSRICREDRSGSMVDGRAQVVGGRGRPWAVATVAAVAAVAADSF